MLGEFAKKYLMKLFPHPHVSVCNGVLKKTGAYDQLSVAYALALQSTAPSIMSRTLPIRPLTQTAMMTALVRVGGNGGRGMKLEAIFNRFNIHSTTDK